VIRKNRSKYNSARGLSEDDITAILLYDVVVDKDSQKAETALLKLPGLRKFYDNLKIDREKEDFRRHMRKYINIWLPGCPFEVSTTNRYTIVTQEAAATARRLIKKGDAVRYLCGNLVSMTPEEEKDLDLTRRDFSIVMSSRKKTPSLFLGPARFANHDCDANARLVTRGSGRGRDHRHLWRQLLWRRQLRVPLLNLRTRRPQWLACTRQECAVKWYLHAPR